MALARLPCPRILLFLLVMLGSVQPQITEELQNASENASGYFLDALLQNMTTLQTTLPPENTTFTTTATWTALMQRVGNLGSLANNQETVRIGTPLILKTSRWEWNATLQMRYSYELFVNWLNRERGGVRVNGSMRPVELILIDDSHDITFTRKATEYLVYDLGVNILLGPYSSDLGYVTADVANKSGAVAVLPASAASTVYEDRPQVFGILPGEGVYMELVFKVLDGKAKTVACFVEGSLYANNFCSHIATSAPLHNVAILGNVSTGFNPSRASITDAALTLKAMDPDLLIICAYDSPCSQFVEVSRDVGFNPKAMFMMQSCVRRVAIADAYMAQYLLAYSPWMPFLNVTSELVPWAPIEFSRNLAATYAPFSDPNAAKRNPALYQAASAFAALEAIIVAIEAADSTEPADIAAQLRVMEYESIFGALVFTNMGKTSNQSFLVQFQRTAARMEVVSPAENLQGESVVYPMPRWEERACLNPSFGRFSLYGLGDTKPTHLKELISSANMIAAARWGASVSSDNEYQVVAALQNILQNAGDASQGPTFFFDHLDSIFTVTGNHHELAVQAAKSYYLTQAGSRICSPCPPNQAGVIVEGQRFCSTCPAGTTLLDLGNMTRICYSDCETGWARDKNGICHACTAGKYSTGGQGVECVECQSGRFNDQVAQIECTACERGKFMVELAATACLECAVGKVSSTQRSTACTSCSSGNFVETTGRSACMLCQPGKVAGLMGASACEGCPPGRRSTWGHINCRDCSTGKFQHLPNRSICTPGPDGATFEGRGLTKGKNKNKWWTRAENGSLTWEYCEYVPQGCLENERCAEGSAGVHCSSCVPGYTTNRFPLENACQKCNADWWNLVATAGTILMLLTCGLIVATFAVSSIKHPQDVHVVLFKMFVEHCIYMSSLAMISQQLIYESRNQIGDSTTNVVNFLCLTAQWLLGDAAVETGWWSVYCMMGVIGDKGKALAEVLSNQLHSEWFQDSNANVRSQLEDFHRSTSVKVVLFWMFWPLLNTIAACFLSGFVLMAYGCKRRSFYKKANKFYRQLVRKGVEYVKDKYSEAEMITFMAEFEYRILKLWWPFQYLSKAHSYRCGQKLFAFLKDTKPVIHSSLLISYAWVAIGVTWPFRCKKYGTETLARMINGSTLFCYQGSGTSGSLNILATMGSVIWGIIFPILLARSLYSRQGDALSSDFLKENSILIIGYTQTRQWWEAVIFFKKYTIVALAHLDFRATYKISSQIFVAILYCAFSTTLKPYDARCSNILMKVDATFTAVWIITAAMTQFAYFTKTGWGWIFCLVVSILLNALLFVYLSIVLWKHTVTAYARNHLRRGLLKNWKKQKSGWIIKRLIKYHEKYQQERPYLYFDPLLGWITVCGDRGDLAIPPFVLKGRQGHLPLGRPALSEVSPVPPPFKDVKVSPGTYENRSWLQSAISETVNMVGIGVHHSSTFSVSIVEFVVRAGFLLSYRYSAKNPLKRGTAEVSAEDDQKFLELCMEDSLERSHITNVAKKEAGISLAQMVSGQGNRPRSLYDDADGKSTSEDIPRAESIVSYGEGGWPTAPRSPSRLTQASIAMGREKTELSMIGSSSDFYQMGSIDTRLELLEDNIRTLREESKTELEQRRNDADEQDRTYLQRLKDRASGIKRSTHGSMKKMTTAADEEFFTASRRAVDRMYGLFGKTNGRHREIVSTPPEQDIYSAVLPGRQKQLKEWATLLFDPTLFRTGVQLDIFQVGLVALQSMPWAEVQFLMDAFEDQWTRHMKLRMAILKRYANHCIDSSVQVEEGGVPKEELYQRAWQALRPKALRDEEEKRVADAAEAGLMAAALNWARLAIIFGRGFHKMDTSPLCHALKRAIGKRVKNAQEKKLLLIQKEKSELQQQVQHRHDKEKEVIELRRHVMETLDSLRAKYDTQAVGLSPSSRGALAASRTDTDDHEDRMLEVRAALSRDGTYV